MLGGASRAQKSVESSVNESIKNSKILGVGHRAEGTGKREVGEGKS